MNAPLVRWIRRSERRRLARRFAPLARPGAVAWTLALGLALCGWLLPDNRAGRVCASMIVVTAIVLLATGRSWQAHRRQVEGMGLATALGLTIVMLDRIPPVLQVGLTPVLMLFAVLGVLAWSEWRFAPDCGQEGVRWAFKEGVRGALWAGLGIAVAIVASAALGPLGFRLQASAIGAGALAGRLSGLIFSPLRTGAPAGPSRLDLDSEGWEDSR